jgi:hypothetical protein
VALLLDTNAVIYLGEGKPMRDEAGWRRLMPPPSAAHCSSRR